MDVYNINNVKHFRLYIIIFTRIIHNTADGGISGYFS